MGGNSSQAGSKIPTMSECISSRHLGFGVFLVHSSMIFMLSFSYLQSLINTCTVVKCKIRLPPLYPISHRVEGLNCKRPIQCLASSRILTTHPLTAWRVCTPRLWCVGRGDTLAGRRGGGGSIFWKTPDTALYSTYVSTLCLNG